MRARDKDLPNGVRLSGDNADNTPAAPVLLAISVSGDPLDEEATGATPVRSKRVSRLLWKSENRCLRGRPKIFRGLQ